MSVGYLLRYKEMKVFKRINILNGYVNITFFVSLKIPSLSCTGLLLYAVRRTLPVLPYVRPHTSVVSLSYWLPGAGWSTRVEFWGIAGSTLPHPKSM